MKLSDDLNDLIESAQTDGKLSEKERQVIIKKAVNEGHDKDEFEIYLDGLVQKDDIDQKGAILAFFLLLFTKPKRFFLIIGVPSIIIFLLTTDIFMAPDKKREKDLNIKIEKLVNKQDFDCNSIDNCLSNYNFEAARLIANLINQSSEREGAQAFQKIINLESIYWVSENDYDRAYNIILEGKDYFTEYGMFKPGLYYGSMYNLITKIVDEQMKINDFKTAKKWILKLPDAVYDSYYQLIYEKGDSDYDKNKTMQKILTNRIKEVENLTK